MAKKAGMRNIFEDFAGRTSTHGIGTLASAGSLKLSYSGAVCVWAV